MFDLQVSKIDMFFCLLYLCKIDKIYSELQKKSSISDYICVLFLENVECDVTRR